jgi:hypothetical protein
LPKDRAELDAEWVKFRACMVFIDTDSVDDAKRELDKLVAFERQETQVSTLRWAASQAREALNFGVGNMLERLATRVEAGELEVPR